jgi:hypothetical protein
MKKGIVLILAQLMCVLSWAQPDRPTNGVRTSEPQAIGIKDATIQLTPTEKLEQADLLIENGRIVKIGHNLTFPAGTMGRGRDRNVPSPFICGSVHTERNQGSLVLTVNMGGDHKWSLINKARFTGTNPYTLKSAMSIF